MRVDKVHIVFENCEYIEIPYSNVRYLHLAEISETIWDNSILYANESDIEFTKYAKSARIIMADRPEYARVKQYNDITHVELLAGDVTVANIGIHWSNADYSEQSNLGQCVVESNGELDIRINMEEV